MVDDKVSKPRLFSALLETETRLPFFRANTCMMVDRIAKVLGGRRCRTVKMNEIVSWLFPTAAVAEKHMLLCLLFSGGKYGYFCNLARRARRAQRQVLTATVIPICCQVHGSPGSGENTIFHIILSASGSRGETNLIHVVPEPGREDEFLVFDPCSWKDTMDAHNIDVLLHSGEVVSGKPSKHRVGNKSSRKPRRVKRKREDVQEIQSKCTSVQVVELT